MKDLSRIPLRRIVYKNDIYAPEVIDDEDDRTRGDWTTRPLVVRIYERTFLYVYLWV
jgi:hypothetical protein